MPQKHGYIMAKEKEKRIAFDYFTKQGFTAKKISEITGVTEKTIGDWISKGNWKSVRDATLNNSASQVRNIKELISELTEQQLELQGEIKEAKEAKDRNLVTELRKQSSALSQEVAIQTKALEKLDKDTNASLAVYLEVMDDLFRNLEHYDKDVYLKTLGFQEHHLQTISLKLG